MRTDRLEMQQVLINDRFKFCVSPGLTEFFIASDLLLPSTEEALHLISLHPILMLGDLDTFHLPRAG